MTRLFLPAVVVLSMCAHAQAVLLDDVRAVIDGGVQALPLTSTSVIATDTAEINDDAASDELPKLPPWPADENWPDIGRRRGHSADPGGLLRPCGGPLQLFNLRPLFSALLRPSACTCSDCVNNYRGAAGTGERWQPTDESGIGAPPSSPPEFDEINQTPADEAL